MLRDIIKKEILDHLLSPKFVFMFISCSALILLSVYMGISNYLLDKKEYEASVASVRENLQSQKNGGFAFDLIKVYRPPQVLEAIVSGISGATGRMSNPNNSQESHLAESKYGSNPARTVFGTLDLEFIVRVVLSLFVLLFIYDAISGEREHGTLKLALANNVPRARLLLGKVIGGYVSLILPLLVPLSLGFVMLSLYPGIALTGDDWRRLGCIFLLFLFYLSTFFTLGLFVSSLTARSSTSFFAVLAMWVTLVMVIPDLSALTAGRIRPVPAASEISVQKGLATYQLQQESSRIQSEQQSWRVFTAEAIRKGVADAMQTSREFNLRINEINAHIDRDYQMHKEAQYDLAKNLSRVSPATGLTFGAAVLARTGVDEYGRFMESTRIYRSVIRDWGGKADEQGLQVSQTTDSSGNVTGINMSTNTMGMFEVLASMPQHEFEPENLGQSIQRALPDFVLMAVMSMIFFVGAYIAFLRYDVR